MELGKRIKHFRNELSLSQDVLAEKVFVSRQTISNWENDKSYPDVNSLVLLSEIFGTSIDNLIKGDIEKMREEIKGPRAPKDPTKKRKCFYIMRNKQVAGSIQPNGKGTQFIYLNDDTIRRNIAFGIKDDEINDKKIWEALEQAQLKSFVEELPDGLDTEVGERGARISGGQRQRLGIARALYNNPEILVFDEATSALDNETEKEVMSAIEGLQGTKTILMIAHRLTTIENCDEIYRVENGTVVKVDKNEVLGREE